MIERSAEVTQFKQRLHSLSHQRFAGEVDNALMLGTLRKLLARQVGEEVTSPVGGTSQSPEQSFEDDDIGPLTKAILIGIMLISVGFIVVGLMQK